MSAKLSESEIRSRLSALSTWKLESGEITRTFSLPTFPAALLFVSTVGHLAEAANHHPDILIKWRHVTLTLSTHDAGGLTAKDFDLAAQIDALPMPA